MRPPSARPITQARQGSNGRFTGMRTTKAFIASIALAIVSVASVAAGLPLLRASLSFQDGPTSSFFGLVEPRPYAPSAQQATLLGSDGLTVALGDPAAAPGAPHLSKSVAPRASQPGFPVRSVGETPPRSAPDTARGTPRKQMPAPLRQAPASPPATPAEPTSVPQPMARPRAPGPVSTVASSSRTATRLGVAEPAAITTTISSAPAVTASMTEADSLVPGL